MNIFIDQKSKRFLTQSGTIKIFAKPEIYIDNIIETYLYLVDEAGNDLAFTGGVSLSIGDARQSWYYASTLNGTIETGLDFAVAIVDTTESSFVDYLGTAESADALLEVRWGVGTSYPESAVGYVKLLNPVIDDNGSSSGPEFSSSSSSQSSQSSSSSSSQSSQSSSSQSSSSSSSVSSSSQSSSSQSSSSSSDSSLSSFSSSTSFGFSTYSDSSLSSSSFGGHSTSSASSL